MPPAAPHDTSAASHTVETTRASVPRLIAPHLLFIAGIAQISLDHLCPLVELLSTPWTLLGWISILLGIAIQITAVIHFRRHRTSILPHRPSQALVSGGVYAFTRNPMYLGMVLILIGGVIIGGSLSPAIVPPLFVWAISRQLIPFEETMLEQQFGNAYNQYRQRVRRWI